MQPTPSLETVAHYFSSWRQNRASKVVNSVSIGLDGTCMYLRSDGYRIAMVGTIALYDKEGERLHTIYIAAPPEHGKAEFMSHLEQEILDTKKNYPKAIYVGVADGAQDNWTFLNRHTSIQVTDFWHVTEYLSSASEVIFSKRQEQERQLWLEDRCHKLKHLRGAASRILTELENIDQKKLSSEEQEKLNKTISYFRNQKSGTRNQKPETKTKILCSSKREFTDRFGCDRSRMQNDYTSKGSVNRG